MDDIETSWAHNGRDVNFGDESESRKEDDDHRDADVGKKWSRKRNHPDDVDEQDMTGRKSLGDDGRFREITGWAGDVGDGDYDPLRDVRSPKFPRRSPEGRGDMRPGDYKDGNGDSARRRWGEPNEPDSSRSGTIITGDNIQDLGSNVAGHMHDPLRSTDKIMEQSSSRAGTYPEDRGDDLRLPSNTIHDTLDGIESGHREDMHPFLLEISNRGVHGTKPQTPDSGGKPYGGSNEHGENYSDRDTNYNISGKLEDAQGDEYYRGRDRDWNNRGRDRGYEGSKDYWRKDLSKLDAKDSIDHDSSTDWHHEQERLDGSNYLGRAGYRKSSRPRSDTAKGSSFGNRYDNSDSIEIRPNRNLDAGTEGSVSASGRSDVGLQQEFSTNSNVDKWTSPNESRTISIAGYGEGAQDRFHDDGLSVDRNSGGGSFEPQSSVGRGFRGTNFNNGPGQGVSSSSVIPSGRGGRAAPRGRGRSSGRGEAQRTGVPLPMLAPPPYGPVGLAPVPIQPMGPNMPHAVGPPIGMMHGFPGPLVWPGGRGMDMSMLTVPPNLPPLPPAPAAGPRFSSNLGSNSNNGASSSQSGAGRIGGPPIMSGSNFNPMSTPNRDMQHDKTPSVWIPQRGGGPAGKAPSRGEQNDYSQNFVDTGMRPQNFIRELELTSVVEDYPKLRELIQRKDEIVAKSATPPMYHKCDLREQILSPEFFGTKFDVILVDPPWEEYVHRAPGITDHMEHWAWEDIMNLKIETIADTPSFIFLWVGDGVGLEQGRQCLKKWGFRRCEDICWVKTNKKNATPGLRHDSHTLFQHSKEHCLMGIKGTVRRSTDGHIIHANIDTDIIIAEEPVDGATKKPDDMYRIIEHFALGRRRLELFGEDHNIRPGWLTLGKDLSSSNFNKEAYVKSFSDKDGKVWQGGGGRNPPPEAPHLVVTTPEIEGLRPKSPPAKSQQQPLPPLGSGSLGNRRPSGNSHPDSVTVITPDPTLPPPPWSSAPPTTYGSSSDAGPGPSGSGAAVFDSFGSNPPYL